MKAMEQMRRECIKKKRVDRVFQKGMITDLNRAKRSNEIRAEKNVSRTS